MKLRLKVRRAGSPPGGSGRSDERTVFDWDFEKNSLLMAGRGEQMSIVLPHPTVSNEHFSIEPGKARCLVMDLGSLNGTFLNGRTLVPHEKSPLAPGDVLGAGPFVLLVSDPRTEALENACLGTRSLALELARQMIGDDPEERPYLTVEEGPDRGARLVLPIGQPVVIGRDEGCHLSVTDPDVSRKHARIYNTLDGCWLNDMESKNGVFVDERKVTGAWRLENGRRIRLGGTVLFFSDPAELYLESLENMADQVIGENGGVFETGAFDDFLSDEERNDSVELSGSHVGGSEDDARGKQIESPENRSENIDVGNRGCGGVGESIVESPETDQDGLLAEDASGCGLNPDEGAGLGWILLLVLGGILAAGAAAALVFLIKNL